MVTAKNNNLSASLEDYLEAIFNLADRSSMARSKDIAKLLGVSKSSVTGALRVLKQRGLANYKPYDSVTLTKAGQAAAAEIVRKHNILKYFFVNVLGIELRGCCLLSNLLLKIVKKVMIWQMDSRNFTKTAKK